jgi:hypothetical protein
VYEQPEFVQMAGDTLSVIVPSSKILDAGVAFAFRQHFQFCAHELLRAGDAP